MGASVVKGVGSASVGGTSGRGLGVSGVKWVGLGWSGWSWGSTGPMGRVAGQRGQKWEGFENISGWSQQDLWGEVRGEGAGLSLNRGHCGGGTWPIRDGWKVKGWSLGVRGRQGGDSAGIRPETHSPGMFSWFPIFFPIKVGPAAAILGWRPSWAWQEISHFGLG